MHHSARDAIRRNNGESNITVPSVFKMQLFYMYRQTNAKISTLGTDSMICTAVYQRFRIKSSFDTDSK